MTTHTAYRTFHTAQRRQFARITEDVAETVAESEIREGMVLQLHPSTPSSTAGATSA